MPVFCMNNQLHYFAHVPKCAGTAVEHYLRQRFGNLGFQDSAYLKVPPAQRWSKSSPQHIDVAALSRLIPLSFFKKSFAVVRHPVPRLRSVFLFQRDIERSLPAGIAFGDFLKNLLRQQDDPYYLDNHPRPMSELVPEDALVFHIENGTDAVITYLDRIAGNQDGPREIQWHNSYRQWSEQPRNAPGPLPEVTEEIRALISELYAVDFDRFGYCIDDWQEDPAPSVISAGAGS